MTLTAAEARQRVEQLRSGGPAVMAVPPARAFKHIHTLPEQAEALLDSLVAPDGISLGLPQLDVLTRGFRPKDLVLVTGFSHSGKTQLINTMLVNNPDRRVLFFSLDDPAEMILAKLVAMIEGVPADQLERDVRAGSTDAKSMVRAVARDAMQNLIVVDSSMGIPTMQEAIAEATEHWNGYPHAVVIDYLELMPGNGRSDEEAANVKAKAKSLKSWANQLGWPTIVLHQGTRSNSKPGMPITMLSTAFGGEQEATILVGVRRKRDWQDLDAFDRDAHKDTVTVHIVKNKRPGGRLTHFDGVDFYMEPSTGMIRPLREGDVLGVTTKNPSPAQAATRTAPTSGSVAAMAESAAFAQRALDV